MLWDTACASACVYDKAHHQAQGVLRVRAMHVFQLQQCVKLNAQQTAAMPVVVARAAWQQGERGGRVGMAASKIETSRRNLEKRAVGIRQPYAWRRALTHHR